MYHKTEKGENMSEKLTNSEMLDENNNWSEKMLSAAITDNIELYYECAENMNMVSYLQQPAAVTALKLATMHGCVGFITSLIGDAYHKNTNVDSSQGVYGYLKQEVSQEDLSRVLQDNPIETFPQEDQEWAANMVEQVFASEKYTKADEMVIQLMKYSAQSGMLRHLRPNALRGLVKNDFKIESSENFDQLKMDKLQSQQDNENNSEHTLTTDLNGIFSRLNNAQQRKGPSVEVDYKTSSVRE